MKSLIGTWVVCNITFTSFNPILKVDVEIKADNVKCKVIDDKYIKVGTPDWIRTPIWVDCSDEINWLNPKNTDGTFHFFKEDKDCKY